jgi:hypothetical protein
MQRSECEFCLAQSQRLLELAAQCSDAELRDELAMMADEWNERAKLSSDLVVVRSPGRVSRSAN